MNISQCETVYNKKTCNLYKAFTSSTALHKLVLTYIHKRNKLIEHITQSSLKVKNYDMVN